MSLIGYSFGADMIMEALRELDRHNRVGLVENAVLLGAPISCDKDVWMPARRVVSGRLVNAFSSTDYLLAVVRPSAPNCLYRAMQPFATHPESMQVHRVRNMAFTAAGIQPVKDVPGIENINVGPIVRVHSDYATKAEEILDVINL